MEMTPYEKLVKTHNKTYRLLSLVTVLLVCIAAYAGYVHGENKGKTEGKQNCQQAVEALREWLHAQPDQFGYTGPLSMSYSSTVYDAIGGCMT